MAAAASVPAPAATSQTKWRSAAACGDGRAHHTPGRNWGGGLLPPPMLPRPPTEGLLQAPGRGRMAGGEGGTGEMLS